MSRIFLKAANSFLNFIVVFSLCIAATYAGYALWDNNQVYAAAENVQDSMIKMKPVVAEGEEGASFEELLAVNPDVCAWVSVDNTNIDFPILQGETNLSYINKDVYGNFALAGSIFWIPEMIVVSMIWYLFCMVTIWKEAICSAIWINLRIRHFLMKIRPVS